MSSEPNRALYFDVDAEIHSASDAGGGDAAYDLCIDRATASDICHVLAAQLERTIRAALWSPADGDVGHILTIRIRDARP